MEAAVIAKLDVDSSGLFAVKIPCAWLRAVRALKQSPATWRGVALTHDARLT